MHLYENAALRSLLEHGHGPCISIYLPTHRSMPDRQQDPIRYRNLVREAEQSLAKALHADDVSRLLAPFHALAVNDRFWHSTLDGLAVLGSPSMFRVLPLRQRVSDVAVVAESFHVKPLLHIYQSMDRYHVLAISRTRAALYGGDRNGLDKLTPHADVPLTLEDALGTSITNRSAHVASGSSTGGQAVRSGGTSTQDEIDLDTERFFRAVDRAVAEHHSRPTGLPLILAALPEHQALFHKVSHNGALTSPGIDVNPDALDAQALATKAWSLMEPEYLARLRRIADDVGASLGRGSASDDVTTIASAAVEGRIDTLVVEDGRTIPGRIDTSTGAVSFYDLAQPDIDDVLDDIAEIVLRQRGTVRVLPASMMPSRTGVAAILRW
jgi:Bacterial archaeo-eukaryotic release factor family 3